VLKLINEKIEGIKTIYQERIRSSLRYEQQLLRKIYLYNKFSPNAYSIINLSLEEIFTALSQLETDSAKIWR